MNAAALCAALLSAIVLAVGSFGFGYRTATNAAEANQSKEIAQAHARYVKGAEDAQTDAAAATAALAALRASYADLKRRFSNGQDHPPLIVAAAGCGSQSAQPSSDAGGRGGPSAPGAGAGPGAQAGQAGNSGGDAGGLTAWSVWVWNSSLAGRDMPVGACGAADPANPACAAGTGVDLDDAWANHAENAESCAEDRARHQRLIDFINKRQGSPARQP